MKRGIILALLMLGGCATSEKYEAALNSWTGSSEASLISAWGPPDNVYQSGGTKYLTYQDSSTVTIPGTSPSYETTIIGSTAYTNPIGGTSPSTINFHCKTTFTIQADKVSSWRYEGNNCISR